MKTKAIINHPALRWSITTGYATAIAALSLLPGRAARKLALPLPHFDKWAHGIMHGGFALLLCWALQIKIHRTSRMLTALAISIAYGITMEIGQNILKIDRTFSWNDIAANTCGVIVALVLVALYTRTIRHDETEVK